MQDTVLFSTPHTSVLNKLLRARKYLCISYVKKEKGKK